ncbi:MAG TPA: AHH domain-containing protein [Archangium sp.]|jgi:hypothetical protein|uniref:AHH domain-containing protein n=1 Tax=Archangium sp. TaxID=1872627 RepID=UPI002ED8C152
MLRDGRLRLELPPLPIEPGPHSFSVEEAQAVLAEFHEVVAQLKPGQVPVAQEVSKQGSPLSLGERWLREQYQESYGGLPKYPLPEKLEGSALLLVLRLSPNYMPEGVRDAAHELLKDPVFLASVASSLVLYGIAWAAPEPLFTKAFAVSVTLVLTLVFTVAELVHFGTVCMQLYQDTRNARTQADIQAASERFGRYLGGAGLRILAYLAGRGLARALPNRPPGGGFRQLLPQRRALPSSVPHLPEGTQVDWSTATSVWASVSEGSVVLSGAAVGATSQGLRGACKDGTLKLLRHTWHHLATARNPTDSVRGGPWTPRFLRLFAKAGMNLEASENLVYLEGHAGPHPEAYHEEIHERLARSVGTCRTVSQCRARLVEELRRIADEVCTPGSRLNRLATKPPK